MEKAGHTCVGHCEIDKYADKSYRAMHDVKGDEWFATDIREVGAKDIPRANCWCFGFPCQDISIAGGQSGLEGKRSGLFFRMCELLEDTEEEDRPELLFIENVRNLLSINRGRDFLRVISELDKIGYDSEWQLINSASYVPQNRERIYVVGHLRGRRTRKVFPITASNPKAIRQIIGGQQGNRVYGTDGASCTLASQAGGQGAKTGLYFVNRPTFHTAEQSNVCQTLKVGGDVPLVKHEVRAVLTPDRENKRQLGRRFKEEGEPSFALTAQDKHGVLVNSRIRRLTPKEAFRLQGFPDSYFEKARKVNSDNQLYKEAGNGVTVNVIYDIARRLEVLE